MGLGMTVSQGCRPALMYSLGASFRKTHWLLTDSSSYTEAGRAAGRGGHPVLAPSLPPQPSSQNSLDFWKLEGYCVALGKPPGSYWHILPLL